MFSELDYKDIDNGKVHGDYIIIDVRSPSEYDVETIPGSINIPIFNDEERALIGTVYKQESAEKAKKIGIDIVSKKLPNIYSKVSELEKQYNNLIFFCSRGGFRSSSLVSLFRSLGINVAKINNGYKGYRKYIVEELPKVIKDVAFIVLYGNTGTGKTHILEELQKEGMNILDLEGCANHRGSTLGSVGLGEQNTQKMFESLLYESLKSRKTNIVFTEGESKRIGKDIIPPYLFQAIQEGINIKIEANMDARVNNILKDYVNGTDDELIEALGFLKKYLGNENTDRYIELIKKHDYITVIEELITKYYDPLYEHNVHHYTATFHNEEANTTAREIIKWINQKNP